MLEKEGQESKTKVLERTDEKHPNWQCESQERWERGKEDLRWQMGMPGLLGTISGLETKRRQTDGQQGRERQGVDCKTQKLDGPCSRPGEAWN
jgi:hypothetical protein